MSAAEVMHLLSQALIVIGTFILYRTGNHMLRVWSEMRTELVELRGLIKKLAVTGEEEKRTGGTSISKTRVDRHSPSTK